MEKLDFEYALKLNSYIEITIDDDGDNDTYHGVVVSLSDIFITIIEIDDFHADGLTVIPINRIEKFECGHSERNKKKILKFNGLEIESDYSWLNLSSFKDLFKSIQQSSQSIFVESNDVRGTGFIHSSEKNHLIMQAFSPSGIQSDDPAVLDHKNIYAVCIGDEYSSVLCKYAKTIGQK